MDQLPRLGQVFNRKHGDALAQPCGRGLECGIASAARLLQRVCEERQSSAVHYRGKGLGKSADRGYRYCRTADLGMANHNSYERRGQERQIHRHEYGSLLIAGCQRGAYSGERSSARRVVPYYRRELLQLSATAGDSGVETCFAENFQRPLHQRLAGKLNQRLVRTHAARFAAGENKAGRVQRPASSRKRISDSMPSLKFSRLNFSLGA